MNTVWMLAEICGPETLIESMHASREGAVDRKRELIAEHIALGFGKSAQRYGDSLRITEHEVKP